MQLALIPPRGWERHALRSRFHLALAQVNNKYYTDVYKQAAHEGHHIIVDNGAAEGLPVGDYKLYYVARELSAHEVVLPDVMFDGDLTIKRANEFEKNIRDSAYILGNFDYVGVAQGSTFNQVKDCIKQFADIKHVRTIGIPRHLITTLRMRWVRPALAEFVERELPNRFKIHFLGTNPSVPSEIYRAARELPFVRSVDTSMPFNYAIAGIAMSLNMPAVGRPSNYFDFHQNMSTGLLKQNIETMKRWVAGSE